jgi:hypothetical protein
MRPSFSSSLSVALLILSACAEPAEDSTSEAESALLAGVVVPCSPLTMVEGSYGSGQDPARLVTRELTGTRDVWAAYLEFPAAAVNAECAMRLPPNVSAAALTQVAARVNFRGPTFSAQAAFFEAFDSRTSTWVRVGTTSFARNWRWSATDLMFPAGDLSRFFVEGVARVRYRVPSPLDASQLDQLVLVVSANEGAPVDAGTPVVDAGAPVVDAGTPPAQDAGTPSGETLSATYAESFDAFPNPERGFHGTFEEGQSPSFIRTNGMSLARILIRLDDYRARDLDATKLSSIAADLGRVRTAGLKVVLRFTYNFPNTYPSNDPDAPLSRVLAHISQLTPVLRANADVIDTLQAGFIGLWGEWHGSSNGLDTNLTAQRQIVDALLTALPPSLGVQLRYPNAITDLYGAPLTSSEAFTGTAKSRIGLHNDCFLASETDMGTYGRTSTGVGASPAAGKAFIAQIGQFTPIGGETCAVNPPRSQCTTAKAELEQMHYSYMNLDYHRDVLDSWRAGGCFDEIARRIGYRFVLKSAAHTASVARGGAASLQLVLRNVGYASPHNPRPLFLVIEGNGHRRAIALPDDLRRWLPGADLSVSRTVAIPADLPAGTYSLGLWLPDPSASLQARSDYSIRLGNVGVWNAVTGTNMLTTRLTVTE